MLSLLTLLLMVLVGWFWIDSLKTREIASAIGKQACNRIGVQFLDDTVALQHLRAGRNAAGHIRLLRTYRFDYTDTGVQRGTGIVVLLGIEPVRLIVGKDILQ